MKKKTLREISVSGKRVLVRADLNVPLQDGVVTDDTRIRAALPTIRLLLRHNASIILCSHLGRPKGVDPELRMDPVVARLGDLLQRPISKANTVAGPEVHAMAGKLEPGNLLVLENTRFEPGETKNDPKLAKSLAELADVFVNDAFGSAHRAHASTEGVAREMRKEGKPAVAGLLLDRELEFLGRALQNPDHPFITILGGAKVSDKIEVIQNLLNEVDGLLIGGGMANTFLKAKGHHVGESLVEEEKVETARELIDRAGSVLVLPVDVVVADAFDPNAEFKTVPVTSVPEGWRIMDIGPQTVDHFRTALRDARLVVWNGPMGVFEFAPFASATQSVARILADLTATGITTIIGGGDSAAAVHQLELADRISHISTGGGASLEFLGGKALPGLAALDDK
jgi:phosphoglycerate kinase